MSTKPKFEENKVLRSIICAQYSHRMCGVVNNDTIEDTVGYIVFQNLKKNQDPVLRKINKSLRIKSKWDIRSDNIRRQNYLGDKYSVNEKDKLDIKYLYKKRFELYKGHQMECYECGMKLDLDEICDCFTDSDIELDWNPEPWCVKSPKCLGITIRIGNRYKTIYCTIDRRNGHMFEPCKKCKGHLLFVQKQILSGVLNE